MGRHWDTFQRLGWRERLQLVEAAVSLVAVWIGLRTVGYGRTRSLINRTTSTLTDGVTAVGTAGAIDNLAWSISVGARYAPFTATCLHRTLALWWLLRRRGIDSELRIGTAQTDRGFAAHAWLERDGVVLNDAVDVNKQFMAFEQFR